VIIGLKAKRRRSPRAAPSNEASQRAAREVQWLSATAVRQLSTATSITIPRCSGDVRAAEHSVFDGEGRGLTSFHATGRIAQRVRDADGPDGAGVHLRVRTQLHEATLRDHRGRAAIQPDGSAVIPRPLARAQPDAPARFPDQDELGDTAPIPLDDVRLV
jgi:hypothetical protein